MGKVRCWLITIFPPWTPPQVWPPVFSCDFAALLCFPISLFQGRGNFALSSVPLQELSALPGWGPWCLLPSLGVSVSSPLQGMPFQRPSAALIPSFPSPAAVGSPTPYIRRRKRQYRLVLGFPCEPASLQLSHTWVLCSSSYGTHDLLPELYFPLVQVFLSHLSAVPTLWRLLGSCPRMCCSPLGCGFSIAWHYPPPRQSFR